MHYTTLYVKAIIEEVKDFKTFVFEENDIRYTPGQYLTLVYPSGLEEIRRSYSITSTPTLQEPLSIGIKRIDNGFFSRLMMDKIKPGDSIRTTGVGGFFTLPEATERPQTLFFFAAGSGITPVFSLIKTALHGDPHYQVVLLYSNSSPERTVFLHAFKELARLFPQRFVMELITSSSPHLLTARLNRELIMDAVRRHTDEPHQALYYVCGPESYMRLCIFTLQEEGIDGAQIKKETFLTSVSRPALPTPPDKNNHRVTIRTGAASYTVDVHYPDSILQAAKKAHIPMPYSCETGRCGSCAAICQQGKVWHSYNEVLGDAELERSLVLTCTGHPVGGDVVISFEAEK